MGKTNPANIGVGKGGAFIHGHKRGRKASPEYLTWLGMKRRCSDTKYKDYPNWGGRGIRVCPEWDNSFVAFLRDMGLRPTPTHQIDRKDPNGHYEKDNCRWATPKQQCSENRRNIRPVTIDGVHYLSLASACRQFGVSQTVVNERVKRGVALEVAIAHGPSRLHRPRPRESYLRKDGDYSRQADHLNQKKDQTSISS